MFWLLIYFVSHWLSRHIYLFVSCFKRSFVCLLFIMVYFAPLCSSILFSIFWFSDASFSQAFLFFLRGKFSALAFSRSLYSYSRFLTLRLLTQFKMIKSIDIYLLRVFLLFLPVSLPTFSSLSPAASLLQYIYKYIQLTAVPLSGR